MTKMNKKGKVKSKTRQKKPTAHEYECSFCSESLDDELCECGNSLEEADELRCGEYKGESKHFCSIECAADWYSSYAEIWKVEKKDD